MFSAPIPEDEIVDDLAPGLFIPVFMLLNRDRLALIASFYLLRGLRRSYRRVPVAWVRVSVGSCLDRRLAPPSPPLPVSRQLANRSRTAREHSNSLHHTKVFFASAPKLSLPGRRQNVALERISMVLIVRYHDCQDRAGHSCPLIHKIQVLELRYCKCIANWWGAIGN